MTFSQLYNFVVKPGSNHRHTHMWRTVDKLSIIVSDQGE